MVVMSREDGRDGGGRGSTPLLTSRSRWVFTVSGGVGDHALGDVGVHGLVRGVVETKGWTVNRARVRTDADDVGGTQVSSPAAF